jgi:maltooligosyltrehalose trehalohydrolase
MRLVTDLLALRRTDRAFSQQRAGAVDGAVLEAESFVLHYLTPDAADERLLLVNFGVDLVAPSFPEPLLAPPSGYTGWAVHWSSEDPAYGGLGTPEVVTASGWRIQGHSAIVLEPTDMEQTDAGYRTHGQ